MKIYIEKIYHFKLSILLRLRLILLISNYDENISVQGIFIISRAKGNLSRSDKAPQPSGKHNAVCAGHHSCSLAGGDILDLSHFLTPFDSPAQRDGV